MAAGGCLVTLGQAGKWLWALGEKWAWSSVTALGMGRFEPLSSGITCSQAVTSMARSARASCQVCVRREMFVGVELFPGQPSTPGCLLASRAQPLPFSLL